MELRLLASPESVPASKGANTDVGNGKKLASEEPVYLPFSSNARSIGSGRLESKSSPVEVSISLIRTVQVDHNLGSGSSTASGFGETGKLECRN
jgi:hypothetical protein